MAGPALTLVGGCARARQRCRKRRRQTQMPDVLGLPVATGGTHRSPTFVVACPLRCLGYGNLRSSRGVADGSSSGSRPCGRWPLGGRLRIAAWRPAGRRQSAATACLSACSGGAGEPLHRPPASRRVLSVGPEVLGDLLSVTVEHAGDLRLVDLMEVSHDPFELAQG